MNQDNIIKNADRFQQGMSISGIPQTVDVDSLINKQKQEVYSGAFPLEPFPMQAITTKLEKIIVDFKETQQFLKQLHDNPVISKEKKKTIKQTIKQISNLSKQTLSTVKSLDYLID